MSTPPHGSPPWPPPWPPQYPGSQPPAEGTGGTGAWAPHPDSGQNPYPGNPYAGNPYPGGGQFPQPGPYAGPAGPRTAYDPNPPAQGNPQDAYWAGWSGQGYPPPGHPGPGEPGRDPRAPIGGHVPASVSIRQYSAESSGKPMFITLAVLVVVAVVVWWGIRTANQDPPIPAPSAAAPSSSSSGGPTAGSANSIPFDNTVDDAHGVWTIDSSSWSGSRVVLRMTVTVNRGDQVLDFFAFTNADTSQAYEPRPSNRPDDLLGHVAAAGRSVTGTVTFDMPDSESTVFLLDSMGRQVTALIVPA